MSELSDGFEPVGRALLRGVVNCVLNTKRDELKLHTRSAMVGAWGSLMRGRASDTADASPNAAVEHEHMSDISDLQSEMPVRTGRRFGTGNWLAQAAGQHKQLEAPPVNPS